VAGSEVVGVASGAAHWNGVYGRSDIRDVSWFEPEPGVSLELVDEAGVGPGDAIVDVGGGASVLVDRLLDGGFQDVTVVDVADSALSASRARLGDRADRVHWVVADVLAWVPPRTFRFWHDRAVFHFLTTPADRDAYRRTLRTALAPGGLAAVGAFAADGPTQCSGLPTARYAEQDLAAEFAGLRLMRSLRREHHTPQGTMQPFSWVLLNATGEEP
jgi:trans-aconitate methyltransferase